MSNQIPKRIQIDRLTKGEIAIRAAVDAVEEMGCDPRLTDAVILLGRARDSVADFVDGIERKDIRSIEDACRMDASRNGQVVIDILARIEKWTMGE